jgi:hypothetical protein
VWTKIKIEVRGERARLYVHGQEQPTLIVNDLKSGTQGKGGIALWIDIGTVAHFRNLTVKLDPDGKSPAVRYASPLYKDRTRSEGDRYDNASRNGRCVRVRTHFIVRGKPHANAEGVAAGAVAEALVGAEDHDA